MKLTAIISAHLALAVICGWIVSANANTALPASIEMLAIVPGL